jgi:hypothetical protein
LQGDIATIKGDTDNLPTDPADQSQVEAAMFTQIKAFHLGSTEGFDNRLECSSDSEALAHVTANTLGDGGILDIDHLFAGGGNFGHSISVREAGGYTFGAEQGDTLLITALPTVSPDAVFVYVTIQTTQGATLTCEVSEVS